MDEGGALPRRCRDALLRRLTADDLAAFQAVRGDPELARYQGWSATSDDEALAFLDRMAAVPLLPRGDWMQLAVADASSGHLVGDVGVFVSPDGRDAEVGITLARGAQGRGLATAAMEAVLDLLWERTPAERVRAAADARNAPSIRLLERLGFRLSGTREGDFKGERCTEFVYVLERPVAAG
ncbi:putative integron gene cassette protein [Hyaloraphidium curvatum]|nr:putative integron gene cassette protein [Hyaloraphidium curvatum]